MSNVQRKRMSSRERIKIQEYKWVFDTLAEIAANQIKPFSDYDDVSLYNEVMLRKGRTPIRPETIKKVIADLRA